MSNRLIPVKSQVDGAPELIAENTIAKITKQGDDEAQIRYRGPHGVEILVMADWPYSFFAKKADADWRRLDQPADSSSQATANLGHSAGGKK